MQMSYGQYLRILGAGLIFMFGMGCRRDPAANLTLETRTSLAYDATSESNVSVKLERRAVSGGVFNGNYELIAEGMSNSEGLVVLMFPRVNVLDYRITGSGSNWFEEEAILNPDIFLENEFQALDLPMTPKGEITIRLVNGDPFDENDAIQFRTLNVPGNYPTCSNASGTFSGSNVVKDRTCWIEADRYLPYTYRTYRNGEWFDYILDSIWVARGESRILNLSW
jgi:hypothetical protein